MKDQPTTTETPWGKLTSLVKNEFNVEEPGLPPLRVQFVKQMPSGDIAVTVNGVFATYRADGTPYLTPLTDTPQSKQLDKIIKGMLSELNEGKEPTPTPEFNHYIVPLTLYSGEYEKGNKYLIKAINETEAIYDALKAECHHDDAELNTDDEGFTSEAIDGHGEWVYRYKGGIKMLTPEQVEVAKEFMNVH